MAEIIYSKYSNERCRNFAIRTDICEEKDGGRFVEKTALYAEGNRHIENIGRWYEELTRVYAEVGFACNKCEPVTAQQDGPEDAGEAAGDGTATPECVADAQDTSGVRLEYLCGETLEEHLDKLLEAGKIDEAREEFVDYLNKVKAIYDKQPFAVTEEFTRVFGQAAVISDSSQTGASAVQTKTFNEAAAVSVKLTLPDNLTCADITNIDMVCGNLVLTSPSTVLDYEWTFDFPIPCQFVLFRIIHYYLNTHSVRQVLNPDEFFRLFGINKELQATFLEMEASFQRSITQGHVPMRDMYAGMTPGLVNDRIKAMEQENARLKNKVKQQRQLIHDMKNTKIWKAYQKYRNMVERKK